MQRNVMRVELTSRAKKCVADFCEARGMTQVATVSRMLEWFSSAPREVQQGIVGNVPAALQPQLSVMVDGVRHVVGNATEGT